MNEVLLCDLKFKEGTFKLYFDEENKLMRDVWTGKIDENDLIKSKDSIYPEFMKFRKGELLYLHDALNMDLKIWSTAQAKVVNDMFGTAAVHCKKVATVYSSFVHQKSTESATKMPEHCKIFSSEQEAMKFLLG